nr:T9SS type A sorting domain-containing protein [uncultured Draconibacterium sp.]
MVPNVTSVYVPASSVNAYKSAPVWGDNFYSVIKPIPSITAFSIPTQIGSASINEADKTILVTLPYTTTLNNLIATYTLSAGATAKIGTTVQTSGTTANDFSSPVVYAITSEDGLVTENWTVNVTIANTLANITSFTIPNQTGSTVINEEDSTISVTLPYSTSVDNLIASFTLSAGAIARVDTTIQTSGTTANDFTSPVVYAIISEDGLTIKNWTVNVTIAKNTLANIISFSIPNQTGDTVINEEDRTISVTLPYGTSANNLVAIYTLSAGATAKVGTTIQTSGITANDFTSPVVYTITSEDGLTSNNWTVNVSQITGVNSILNSIETKVFPNPSEGIFKLRLKSSEYVNIKFEIINSLGTIILNRKVNFSGEKDELIDLSHASKGIYFLRICTDNNQEQLKLLLK